MIKSKLQQAVNDQITAELWSSNLYLQMSYYLKHLGWDGFAHWMKCHSDEEREHATRMADFLTDRGGLVKLTRTLTIIPSVLVFAFIQLHIKRKEAAALQQEGTALKANVSLRRIFPWFILGFLAMSVIASFFQLPAQAVSSTKQISKFLMVCALAAIGLNTSFASMKRAGIRPMLHGFIISALVVIVALLVEMGMGVV